MATETSSVPGAKFEPHPAPESGDFKPNPSKSLSLPPQRQALLDDILALYSCKPTVERVKRYTPDCVYDDLFGYADDRYKVAAQWFGLPKLFQSGENIGYEVVNNDAAMIQFKSEQKWTFRLVPLSKTMTSLISLSLDPATVDSDFIQIKYHKDQTSPKDNSHEGIGFSFRKWQADNLPSYLGSPELKEFEKDKGAESRPPGEKTA